jgi:hypothetical protein
MSVISGCESCDMVVGHDPLSLGFGQPHIDISSRYTEDWAADKCLQSYYFELFAFLEFQNFMIAVVREKQSFLNWLYQSKSCASNDL